jgi:hypothetical protein
MNIYILRLQRGKYYFDKTNILKNTIREYFTYGSSSNKKSISKPHKKTKQNNSNNFDEDKYTIKYMDKYGVDNVRRGTFCKLKLNNDNLNTTIISDDYDNYDEKGNYSNKINNKIWCCKYCKKEFKTKKTALLHENGNCKYKVNNKNNNNNNCYTQKNNCFRCGRETHYADECYAIYHINGIRLN